MKTSRQWGWPLSSVAAFMIVAAGLTFGWAPAAAQAQCAGDCDNSGDVTMSEVVTVIDLTLGSANAPACPHGIPGGTADITVLVQSVNHALNGGCGTVSGRCGDGHTDTALGEECDDGGTCTGGTNTGAHCTAESDCQGNGICEGGTNYFRGCGGDADCPGGGKCIHCKTFGADGCAANCTLEQDVVLTLKKGIKVGSTITPGTSGAVVHSQLLTIALPLGPTCNAGAKKDKQCDTDADCPGGQCIPAQQTLTIGKARDGLIPVALKAASVIFPRIPVSTLACACLRGVAAETCGGTLFDADGITLSKDCTDGSACPADKPCGFLHGPGNAGSGQVGCNSYAPVDVFFSQDSGGETGTRGKPMITLSGSGPAGSGILLSNNAIGTVQGACAGSDSSKYGADGQFCTDDDPADQRGDPSPQFNVTGTATGVAINIDGTDSLCTDGQNDGQKCTSDNDCPGGTCDLEGPYSLAGNPLSCTGLAAGNVTDAALVSSFVQLDAPDPLGDIVVITGLVGK